MSVMSRDTLQTSEPTRQLILLFEEWYKNYDFFGGHMKVNLHKVRQNIIVLTPSS